jgi:hypothetical protein
MGYYTTGAYPIQFSVDYPDGPLDKFSTFFRIFFLIPIGIVSSIITSAVGLWQYFALLLMIVFRQKYPRWWFDWYLASFQFNLRVQAYGFLMRDEYPSTDDEQAVHLDVAYPDAEQGLNRAMPLVKWFLAIPHWVALIFLLLAAMLVSIVAWFAILFTGAYPRGAFEFVEGVLRWQSRTVSYALMLVTDQYPPFRLRE